MVLICHGQMVSAATLQKEAKRLVSYKPMPNAPSSHSQDMAHALMPVPGIRNGTGVIIFDVHTRR